MSRAYNLDFTLLQSHVLKRDERGGGGGRGLITGYMAVHRYTLPNPPNPFVFTAIIAMFSVMYIAAIFQHQSFDMLTNKADRNPLHFLQTTLLLSQLDQMTRF